MSAPTPTAETWIQAIQFEIGAGLDPNTQPANAIANFIHTLWTMNADKALGGARLQYLYTKRQACDFLLGQLREHIDVNIAPLSAAQSQKSRHVQNLRDDTDKEINVLLKRSQASRPPAIGQIIKKTPSTRHHHCPPVPQTPVTPPAPGTVPSFSPSPFCVPDANDPAYRGDPYRDSDGRAGTGIP